jgi:hypothetical protein
MPAAAGTSSAGAAGLRSTTSFVSARGYSPTRVLGSVMAVAKPTGTPSVARGVTSAVHPAVPEYYHRAAQQQRFPADVSLAWHTALQPHQVQTLHPDQLWLLRQQLHQQALHQNPSPAVASALYANSSAVNGGAHIAAALRTHASNAVGVAFPAHRSTNRTSANAPGAETATGSAAGQDLRSVAISGALSALLQSQPHFQLDAPLVEAAPCSTTRAAAPPTGPRGNPPDEVAAPAPAGDA